MTEKDLKSLYKKYLIFDRRDFELNTKRNCTSLKGIKVPGKIIGLFFENYVKPPFFSFLVNVKNIVYSKNVYDFVFKTSSEDWKLWPYLRFLEKEKIIKVRKTGQAEVLKKDILGLIPAPQSREEIIKKIERRLKTKIRKEKPITDLFKSIRDFEVKPKWDQMPISQGSVCFVVEKILEYLPLKKKFLFIGDDDFASVILGIAEPGIESLVIDMDEELLDFIDALSKRLGLKIKTKKVDIRQTKNLKERFTGFLTNPIYTEDGVKEFVKYGVNNLGKDGGLVFAEIGEESIGNRFLFLQDFFNRKNLIIKELIKGKIFYPYIELYKEDKEILKRLSSMIDKRVIKNSPKLAASLYVFEYLPARPQKIKFKKPIYAYL